MKEMTWEVIPSSLGVILYLLFIYLTINRRILILRLRHWLIAYAILGVLGAFTWLFQLVGWIRILPFKYPGVLSAWLLLASAVVFLGCTLAFMDVRRLFWAWVSVGIIWCIITLPLVLLQSLIKPLLGFHPDQYIIFILFLGLLIVWGITIYILSTGFKTARQPLHLNRLIYWSLALAMTMLGDLFSLGGFQGIGSTLQIMGLYTAGYVVFIHNQLDLVWMLLRFLNFVIIALVGGAVYLLVLFFNPPLPEGSILHEDLPNLAIKALVLLVVVNPALSWLDRYLRRNLLGIHYDINAIVREFSLSVSNILELPELEKAALKVVVNALGIRGGKLLLVNHDQLRQRFSLRSIPKTSNTSETTPTSGSIHESNPIAVHFCQTHKPLRQYDLDFSPVFQSVSYSEREWLSNLGGDLFIPICTKDKWIGLFVILPKTTASSFTEEEIRILCVLADQTVVALENARLFANFRKANQDLLRTQKAFEQANLELRQVDERKSAFIGVITHELRTPISNITLSLHVLEKYLKGQLSPEHEIQFEQIKTQVKEAQLLADDLIMLAAFINDQVELQLEKFNFIEALNNTLEPLQEAAQEKKLHFHLDIVGEMLPVQGDPGLLTNAVYQLVSNAVKFTPENGSIWVSCWSTGTALCLDVEDTGVGIPFGKVEKVWEAFSQLISDPLRRGVEGLGLGLALVRHIVQLHGGIVWVESQEGEGSIFGFDIPLSGPSNPLSAKVRARRAGRLASRSVSNLDVERNTER